MEAADDVDCARVHVGDEGVGVVDTGEEAGLATARLMLRPGGNEDPGRRVGLVDDAGTTDEPGDGDARVQRGTDPAVELAVTTPRHDVGDGVAERDF